MRTVYLFLCVILLSCQALVDAPVPNLYWPAYEASGTKPLPASAYQQLEGVYQIFVSDDDFGDSVVVKWSYDIQGKDTAHYLSFFTQEDVRYFIMQARSSGDSVLLNGYWRNVENTKIGKAHFVISRSRGGFELVSGIRSGTSPVYMKGQYGLFNDDPHKEINFEYKQPLYNGDPFRIIAHRGGGRNNDLLPASENSLEMIHLASRLGANGVEIDVQFTKDGVPVLFHDANLNDRLTRKTGIHGPVSDYALAELNKDVELKRGGKIPTLQDALHTIIYNTPLQFIWLDCKTDAPLTAIHQLQTTYTQKAKEAGRKIEIVIGVPDEKVLRNFMRLPNYQNIPAVCELEQDSATKIGASLWATSWTKGLQLEEVSVAQQKGMEAVAWTLDVPRKIKEFMRQGRFNGIVTNRPSAVAYEYYQGQPQR
jgi:glycerophosphoryl diester phosphodiesterase